MVSEVSDVAWPVEDFAVGLEGGVAHARAVHGYDADIESGGWGGEDGGFEVRGWCAMKVEVCWCGW